MSRVNPWIDPRIIDDMVERFRMSKASERLFRYNIRLYADYLESRGVVFEEATADDVQLFYDHMTSNYSANTSSGALSAVKRLHRWVDGGDIEKVGLGFVRSEPALEPGLRKALSPAEARAVLNACETKRETALISLLMEAALKSGEVAKASVGDIVFLEDCAAMTVHASACRPESIVRIPKLSADKLRRYLDERKPQSADEPLITSESARMRGQRLSNRGIRGVVQQIFARAGIPGTAGDYDLRKTALILAREAGADDGDLMRFARLRSMRTVRDSDALYRYDSASPQEKLSRALNGIEEVTMSYVTTATELRRELERFHDDEIVLVRMRDGSSITFESLGKS